MATKYPNCPDPDSFQTGLEFQDFVCMQLAKQGIVLQNLASKRMQFEVGENLQGFEIKLDRRCTESNRLSIEVAEKSRADMPNWTPSGIYRNDNTWLYIQGNYEVLYVFDVKLLRRQHERLRLKANWKPDEKHGTVRTFYLSLADADRVAAKVIRTNEVAR